ncbi:MFS transporter [Selenomonas noxia]|uniref:MFS transporter n=1 Tax=Selenomonas noxia TaxID=135083 RepID=UPI0028804434|nr:MFS transporter [Selenomonas noxia]
MPVEIKNNVTSTCTAISASLYILPFILVGSFLSIFDQFVINVAAPAIISSLHPSAAEFEGIMSGYALVYGVGLVVGGRLGDRFGRRRIYRLGLFLFAVTSVLCGAAQTAPQLVVVRLLQGLSGAVMVPQVLALIRVSYEDNARVQALSAFGVSIGLGQIMGQVLGGWIPAWDFLGLGWRMIFLANMPICLIAGIGCRALPACPNAAHETYQKQFGNPLRLFRYRGYTVGIFLNVCLYAAIVPFFVVLGLYLQNICELTPQTAGLVFMAVGTGFILASSAGPALMRKFAPPRVLICGTICTSAGILAMLLGTITGLSTAIPFVLLSLFLLGIGNGTVIPIATGIVLRYLPMEDAGVGGAILTTGQQLAGAVGTVLAGALLLTDGNPPVSAAAYVNGLAVQVSAAFAALLCAALLSRIPAPTQ